MQKLLALPDHQLRLLTLLVAGILAGTSLYFFGAYSGQHLMLVLATSMYAPALRKVYLKSERRLVLVSILALATGVMTYPWVPQMFAETSLSPWLIQMLRTLPFVFGLMPAMQEMQASMMKRMGIKVPQPAKPVAKPEKPAPIKEHKKPTVTRRKELARLARDGKK